MLGRHVLVALQCWQLCGSGFLLLAMLFGNSRGKRRRVCRVLTWGAQPGGAVSRVA